MRTRSALLAATLLAGPVAALHAQPVTGPYVSLGAGYNILQDEFTRTGPGFYGPGSPGSSGKFNFDGGYNAQLSAGYGFGNGFRIEIEGDNYDNSINKSSGYVAQGAASGHQETYGGMANVLYDFDFGLGGFTPYLGAGAGYQWSHLSPITVVNNDNTLDRFGGTKGSFAYQGIVGVAYPLTDVLPGLAVTAEYRFLGTLNEHAYGGEHFAPTGLSGGNVKLSDAFNHSFMLGFRYALYQPAPPAPPPPPTPVAAPAPAPARTYLVFFDWDRADLTERARQIIAEAAQASTHVQTTKIAVNGYTDLSGTAAYNQKLSVRRAKSVEAELVRDGVPDGEIAIQGFGESNPLVPTAAGVREPQNRRVEIILH